MTWWLKFLIFKSWIRIEEDRRGAVARNKTRFASYSRKFGLSSLAAYFNGKKKQQLHTDDLQSTQPQEEGDWVQCAIVSNCVILLSTKFCSFMLFASQSLDRLGRECLISWLWKIDRAASPVYDTRKLYKLYCILFSISHSRLHILDFKDPKTVSQHAFVEMPMTSICRYQCRCYHILSILIRICNNIALAQTVWKSFWSSFCVTVDLKYRK